IVYADIRISLHGRISPQWLALDQLVPALSNETLWEPQLEAAKSLLLDPGHEENAPKVVLKAHSAQLVAAAATVPEALEAVTAVALAATVTEAQPKPIKPQPIAAADAVPASSQVVVSSQAVEAASSQVEVTGGPGQITENSSKYGFYMHVFHHPAAVIYQVRQVKVFFPGSPIYIMTDGGTDFSPLCKLEGCTFVSCPPSNDRWHPWPFFRRLYDAALSLKTEFVIMLEPDNTIHGPIKETPKHDAGGLYVQGRTFAGADY
ncbi:unnamed protein product, partial [Polarella glacialis]